MTPRRLGAGVAAFLLAQSVLSPHPAAAQSRTSSAIRGFVVAQGGEPVVGATVTVRHEETGAQRAALTNAQGRFLILLLPPGGPYTVTLDHIAYAEYRQEGLVLQVGDTYTVDAVMRAQAVALEGLEVVADRAELFDPSQIGPATRLSERLVESTPILSRDVMELSLLSPLVKTTDGGGFSIAGHNDRYNALLVDGIVSKDLFGLTSGGVPGGQAGAKLIPLDAVAQYEVLIAPFDIRLSGFTGGVMNAVTRTGTNDWRVRVAAVRRDEALIGDLDLPSGLVEASGVDRNLLAFSAGGPIVRDRGHFFLAGEFEHRRQPPAGFNLGRDAGPLIRISEETLEAFREGFEERFGVEIGEPGVYPLEQELANVFARSDWNFGGSRLTVRNVFARASNDEPPNRSPVLQYELGSNAVFRTSTNNITSAQYFSEVGHWGANELGVTVHRTVDETAPAVGWPQFEFDLPSGIGGAGYRREVRVGSQFFAQENHLEQTSLRITNSLDVQRGDDVLTLGLSGSYYDIAHTFLPGALGEYRYPSFFDLARNAPQRYQRTVLTDGQDEAVEFQVVEWGVFAQHLMNAGKGLTMRFGIRADVPHVLGRPGRNLGTRTFFGYETNQVPSGNILFSPRWGFNWQSEGERRTQVRGGFGVFTGQIPYVWLSNAFHNDGLRSYTEYCYGRWYQSPPEGSTIPEYTGEVTDFPSECRYTPLERLRSVVLFDPGFEYPLDLKFSAAVDRELSDRVSGSLGFLFNRAMNQVSVQELNAEGGSGGAPSIGGRQRRYYERLDPRYEQVLFVTNEGEDWGASLTAELRGAMTSRLGFQLAYSLAKSWDRMSLVFTDMQSNLGFNPVEFDMNRPPLRTSNFDRPHKVVATLYGAPLERLPDTEISILYTAQSGMPFSYVYEYDVNGDGYPGLAGALDRYNDLLLVPRSPDDGAFSIATRILLSGALHDFECFREHLGEVIPRNACRTPWENRLDARLTHTLRRAGWDVRFEADLINVLALIHPAWGRVERNGSVVPIMNVCGVPEGCTPPEAFWGGGVLPSRDANGALRPANPWNALSPDSQWQLQLGMRVTFGGPR